MIKHARQKLGRIGHGYGRSAEGRGIFQMITVNLHFYHPEQHQFKKFKFKFHSNLAAGPETASHQTIFDTCFSTRVRKRVSNVWQLLSGWQLYMSYFLNLLSTCMQDTFARATHSALYVRFLC